MSKSWKTTLAGILQFLGVISTQIGFLFDNIPTTNPDYGLLISSAVVLFGLVFSRDADVSSEQAGLNPQTTEATKAEIEKQVKNVLDSRK